MGLKDWMFMATVNEINPGLGFMGSIVDFMVTDKPNAGLRFIVDIATLSLPGGFLTSLATEAIKELIFGDEFDKTFEEILANPDKNFYVACQRCGKLSKNCARMGSKIVCVDCVRNDIKSKIRYNDKIFVLKNGIYQIEQAKLVYGQRLYGKQLGRNLYGSSTRKKE